MGPTSSAFLPSGQTRVATDTLLCGDTLLPQETGNNCFGHYATADEGEARALEG